MGRRPIKIRYSPVKNGKRYWQPSPEMVKHGFLPKPLGSDNPTSRDEARRLYADWQAFSDRLKFGGKPERFYPIGSMGHAWDRMINTPAIWNAKKERTQEEWEYVWEKWVEPVFGDVDPASVSVEAIAMLRDQVAKNNGPNPRFKLIKIWRAFWQVMAAMQYCNSYADPSKAFTNPAPKGRTATWSDVEIVQIAKEAWRQEYYGLAVLLSISWDTQFAPVDVRTLTLAQLRRDDTGAYFDKPRTKTDEQAIGTLSRRSERVLAAYIEQLPFELHMDAEIFRHRSGGPYLKNKLSEDFRAMREAVFPGDDRKLMDIRRSGAVEALAGNVGLGALGAKMGNSLASSSRLQSTYLPRSSRHSAPC